LRLFAVVVPVLLPAAYGQEIRFDGGRFQITGWTAPAVPPPGGWASILRVYAGEIATDTPAMLGTYSVDEGSLSFRPRFPISPGVRVTALFAIPDAARIERTFTTAAAVSRATARVTGVYPSAAMVPENLLKFYIEFSAPMARGEAWRHLRLLDVAGKAVDLPFLEIDQELWDAEGKRLTVLFDPGRIKRGVLPLEEVGPALAAGEQYTLVVEAGWHDGVGSVLAAPYRKSFRVAEADRTPVNPASWRFTVPAAGTREPLIIRFPEPLDYALLHRMLGVDSVTGAASVAAEEREWRFVPEQPWKAGQHHVLVNTALEDLAGNRVGRAFDVDTFERVTSHVELKAISLPFRVGSHQSERGPR
jgi:hypothetical protein